jgi:ABC-type histidine transport system ATPase subunit
VIILKKGESDLAQNNSIIIGKGLVIDADGGDIIKCISNGGSLKSGFLKGIAEIDNVMSYTSLEQLKNRMKLKTLLTFVWEMGLQHMHY